MRFDIELLNKMMKAVNLHVRTEKKEHIRNIVNKIYDYLGYLPEERVAIKRFKINPKREMAQFDTQKFEDFSANIKRLLEHLKDDNKGRDTLKITLTSLLNESFFDFFEFIKHHNREVPPLGRLSDELLLEIFSHLDFKSKVKISKACSRFREVSADDRLWKPDTFKFFQEDIIKRYPTKRFKDIFAKLYVENYGVLSESKERCYALFKHENTRNYDPLNFILRFYLHRTFISSPYEGVFDSLDRAAYAAWQKNQMMSQFQYYEFFFLYC